MTPEHSQQLNQLFHSALTHERDQRVAFIAGTWASDETWPAWFRRVVNSFAACSHGIGVEAANSDFFFASAPLCATLSGK